MFKVKLDTNMFPLLCLTKFLPAFGISFKNVRGCSPFFSKAHPFYCTTASFYIISFTIICYNQTHVFWLLRLNLTKGRAVTIDVRWYDVNREKTSHWRFSWLIVIEKVISKRWEIRIILISLIAICSPVQKSG